MKSKTINIEANQEPQRFRYAQSANTLFNFMESIEYLKKTLLQKALIPRYYVENTEYLQLEVDNEKFDKIEILQTCFCDIPLSNIFKQGDVECFGNEFDILSDSDKKKALAKNTHPDFYGYYAISFSKSWGIQKHLQSVHYLNEDSQLTRTIPESLKDLYSLEDLPESLLNDFLNRLAYIKPVKGVMEKSFTDEKKVKRTLLYTKVFHDEQEWRFVPDISIMQKYGLENVHANPQAIKERESWNSKLRNESYRELWLNFDYEDIRYLIVPDNSARNELIKIVSELPSNLFGEKEELEKKILISKITVLENLREDI